MNEGVTDFTKSTKSDFKEKSDFTLVHQYGWVCPRCGNVYSPSITFCPRCSKPIEIVCNWQNMSIR